MGQPSYGLWGEESNHRESLKKITEAQQTAGAAYVFGSFSYPPFPKDFLWYYTYTLSSPLLVASLQISRNGQFLANSAYSLVKITFAPFWRETMNSDQNLLQAFYGAGTVWGKDMLRNTVPNSSTTNSTYAIFTNQGDTKMNIYTLSIQSGKWKQNGTSGIDIRGMFRLYVYCGTEHAQILVPIL